MNSLLQGKHTIILYWLSGYGEWMGSQGTHAMPPDYMFLETCARQGNHTKLHVSVDINEPSAMEEKSNSIIQ